MSDDVLQVNVVISAVAQDTPSSRAEVTALAIPLRAGIAALAADLGVPVALAVSVQSGEVPDGEVCRLEIDGRQVVPPLGALLRVACALPLSPVRDEILHRSLRAGNVGKAEQSIRNLLCSPTSPVQRESVCHLVVVNLVLATLRRRPDLLVTAEAARQWWLSADPGSVWPRSWEPSEFLRTLLAAGLSARIDQQGHATVAAAGLSGSALQEAVEWLISRTHTQGGLSLQLHPGIFGQLLGESTAEVMALRVDDERVPAEFREMWSAAAAWMAATTAVLIPSLVLVAEPRLEPGTARVSFQARVLEPLQVDPSDVGWQALAQLAIFAGPAHVLDGIASPLTADDLDRATHFTPPQPLAELLPRIVLAEIASVIHLLLDAEQVAFRLSQIEEFAPELVDAVMERLPLTGLTLLLRHLLAEGIFPTDLPQVLTAIAESDCLAVAEPGLHAFDPRPLVAAQGAHAAHWHQILESVHRAMAARLNEAVSARDRDAARHVPAAARDSLEVAWLGGSECPASDEVTLMAHEAAEPEVLVLVTSDLARPLVAESATSRASSVRVLSEAEAAELGVIADP